MKTIAKVTRLLLGWIVVRGTPRTDDGSPLKLNSQRMGCDSPTVKSFDQCQTFRIDLLSVRGRQLKYGRILAYFLSPIPLTRFRSSALLNGRAAIIRAAITCPIPGTVVSSFSVAVLTSILPSGVFSFAWDVFVSTGLTAAVEELDVGVTEIECEAIGDGGEVALGTLGRPSLMPHPPILRRFASSSNCASFSRSAAELEALGGVAVVPWILARPFATN